eukprot:4182945-Ditylum_brightwellii.AAC.1
MGIDVSWGKHCPDNGDENLDNDNYCQPKHICGGREDDTNKEDDNLYSNQDLCSPDDDDDEPPPPQPDEDGAFIEGEGDTSSSSMHENHSHWSRLPIP